MTMQRAFKATVTHEEDDRWVAVVDGLRGGATEADTLADLEVEVRDLISGLLNLDEDTFDIKLEMS